MTSISPTKVKNNIWVRVYNFFQLDYGLSIPKKKKKIDIRAKSKKPSSNTIFFGGKMSMYYLIKKV
jgi:hypothetical protein